MPSGTVPATGMACLEASTEGKGYMAKALTKPTFGLPSAAAVERISTAEQVTRLRDAYFRYETLMGDLEAQFESKASELRESYISEILEIHGADAA
jgi:hypothetical protein